MRKIDIQKSSETSSSVIDSLFENWETMHQALEDEEKKFKEINITKVNVLSIYLFVMIPVAAICIVATRSIICSFLCVLSLFIPLFIFFRWKRFYVYRSAFPTKSSISVNEANNALDYPNFLIESDFRFFSKSGFCKNAFYDSKACVLFLRASGESVTEESSVVEDEPINIADLVSSLKSASESIAEESLRSAVVKLYSSLDSVEEDAFNTQFSKHLLRVYLEPLAKLLNSGNGISDTDCKKLLELLQILDYFVEDVKEVMQVSRSDGISIDLDTILRLAKMDRKAMGR